MTQVLESGKLRGKLSSLIGQVIEFYRFFMMVLVGKFLLKFGVWRSWKCLILSTRIHGEVPFRLSKCEDLEDVSKLFLFDCSERKLGYCLLPNNYVQFS